MLHLFHQADQRFQRLGQCMGNKGGYHQSNGDNRQCSQNQRVAGFLHRSQDTFKRDCDHRRPASFLRYGVYGQIILLLQPDLKMSFRPACLLQQQSDVLLLPVRAVCMGRTG
ncbi:hypothetical protein D3C71_1929690 [compost metagenome]